MANHLPGLTARRLVSTFFTPPGGVRIRPAHQQFRSFNFTSFNPTPARSLRFSAQPLRIASAKTARAFRAYVPKYFVQTRPASTSAPVASATASSSSGSHSSSSSFFPEVSARPVGIWLVLSAVSVFGIVVLGGLTRLTESGLSITEWKPITGALPPRSDEEWEENFALYRASPEFKILNSHMNLEEYKFIYYMEWAHRQWGRFIGLSFVLPAIFFVATRRVSKPMAVKLAGISAMIGFQGFIGWWMVKSGLQDDLFKEPGSTPRVSQYRLTAHLGAAFTVYAAMLWNGLRVLRANKLINKMPAQEALSFVQRLQSPAIRPVRIGLAVLAAMVFTTAMSGGLVAGLDAGLIYNEFPMMGSGLTPPKSELFSPFYSHTADGSDIWWRNLLENPSTVQLQHRILAVSTFTAIVAFVMLTRRSANISKILNKREKSGIMGVMHMAVLQVTLGISTLIYMVPTHLAATHQAGSLMLLTFALMAAGRVAVPKRLLAILKRRADMAAVVKKAAEVPRL
ncbi:COX15-CtaA-domain-containing protein [Ascobolus immersus RN42]|uniref:COX15-CtaA-domain-containing protein n=1 Tax=Ascobolus immersus RN42 TaxID=1160509 RepID=A0A3N4IRY2_ASCIM|nr:COX15-CtaA-domain-containing protein [Ascobolus immersus RN42]